LRLEQEQQMDCTLALAQTVAEIQQESGAAARSTDFSTAYFLE
jgi:hypothetical protein